MNIHLRFFAFIVLDGAKYSMRFENYSFLVWKCTYVGVRERERDRERFWCDETSVRNVERVPLI